MAESSAESDAKVETQKPAVLLKLRAFGGSLRRSGGESEHAAAMAILVGFISDQLLVSLSTLRLFVLQSYDWVDLRFLRVRVLSSSKEFLSCDVNRLGRWVRDRRVRKRSRWLLLNR